MALSIGTAIDGAMRRTGHVLFRPFEVEKWFVMGFCAWLASLGQGGFNFNLRFPWGPGRLDLGHGFHDLGVAVPLVLTLAGVCAVVGIALVIVLAWLSARGSFMFLDGVARNRGAVVEPWHQFREQGNSLFWFRVVLFLIGLLCMVVIVGVGFGLALPDLVSDHFGPMAVVGIVVGGMLFLPFVIVMAVVMSLLDDFIVPIMYLRGLRTVDAWKVFRHEVAAGYFWNFVVFYLVKFLIGIAVAIIAALATCLTCCIAALPYIGTVILLPLHVFMRCYSLCFLQQFGPGWQVFEDEAPPEPMPGTIPPAQPQGFPEGGPPSQ